MRDCGSSRRSAGGVVAGALGITILLSGCFGGGPKTKTVAKPRVEAAGNVTYEGTPLAEGKISFINIETGNTSAGDVKDGAFKIDAANGPNPGKQGVVVLTGEWRWSGEVEVPDDGLNDAKFAVEKKATKPAPKANPDDI